MRILVVAPRPPYPLYGGYEVRVYPLFKVLSNRHELSLISRSYNDADQGSIPALKEVFSSVELFRVTKEDPRQRKSVLRRIADLWSPGVDYHDRMSYSLEMLESFKRKAKNGEFDVLHVLGLNILSYLPGLENLPSLCDAVDDYSLYCYRTMTRQDSWSSKFGFFLEWIATRKFEKKFIPLFKEVVLVSPIDAGVVRRLCPDSNVSVIPNGVDSDRFRPAIDPPAEPTLVFSGVMDYEPNVTGAYYFANSILPIIEKSVPNVEFWIVGRDPAPQIQELAETRRNIKVTGFVDDIRTYVDQAMVYVCPLLSGTGIKNKILEAWSMEKAVVATTMSCDGIEISDGKDIVVADSAQDFAASVVKLIKDGDFRTRIGTNARRKVIERYSWEAQAACFEQIYNRLVPEVARTTRTPLDSSKS